MTIDTSDSNNQVNPFVTLGIEVKFEIDAILDSVYFAKYRENSSAELNIAYNLLKDPIKRAKILCELNNVKSTDHNIATEMIKFMNASKKEIENLQNEAYEKILLFAKNEDWKSAWRYLQTYSYLQKMV